MNLQVDNCPNFDRFAKETGTDRATDLMLFIYANAFSHETEHRNHPDFRLALFEYPVTPEDTYQIVGMVGVGPANYDFTLVTNGETFMNVTHWALEAEKPPSLESDQRHVDAYLLELQQHYELSGSARARGPSAPKAVAARLRSRRLTHDRRT